MAWDDDKQVAPGTEEGELTPEEWNEHVADQKNHSERHEGGADSLNVFNLTGDLVGQGLEKVNDTLQVLSSIWDGANVVADVDNTNTTTQALEAEEVNNNPHPDENTSTEEINDNFEDLSENGGGEVTAQIGTHVLTEDDREELTRPYAIRLRDRVNLRGHGVGSRLQTADTVNALYAEWDNDEPEADDNKFVVENLELDGNKDEVDEPDSDTTHEHTGFLTYGFQKYLTANRLLAHDFHGNGVHTDATYGSTISDSRIWDTGRQAAHIATRTADGTIYGPRYTTFDRNVMENCDAGVDFGGDETRGSKMIANSAVGVDSQAFGVRGFGHVVLGNTATDTGQGISFSPRRTDFDPETFETSFRNVAVANTFEDASRAHVIRDNKGSLAGFTTVDGTDSHGVDIEDSEDLTIGPYYLSDVGSRGVTIDDSTRVSFVGVTVDGAGSNTFDINSDNDGIELIGCAGIGSEATWAALIRADGTKMTNFTGSENDIDALNIRADNCVLNGGEFNDNGRHGCRMDGNENIIRDVSGSGNGGNLIQNNGDRNIIDGRSTNSGDPNTEGVWAGHEDFAEDHNAIIEDTTNDDLYMAVGGSFVQINA